MTRTCKECHEVEDKQYRAGLVCEACGQLVHLSCLSGLGTPGDLSCDVFFDFECSACSDTHTEKLRRNKFPWANVIYLTLYHLSTHSQGISRNGFFHYKTHVCSFINRHWEILFGSQVKQKKNFVGTIAGVLSVYNKLLFRSGSAALRESGWWRLQHGFSPAVAAHVLQELSKDKPGGRAKIAMCKELFYDKVVELGYQELYSPGAGDSPAAKRRKMEPGDFGDLGDYDAGDRPPSELYFEAQDVKPSPAQLLLYRAPAPPAPGPRSDTSSNPPQACDSDPPSPRPPSPSDDDRRKQKTEEKPYLKRETAFSSLLNSVTVPWEDDPQGDAATPGGQVVPLSVYEELQLLKAVEGLVGRGGSAGLRRFRAKLQLRRLKRHKHLPVFDLEKSVLQLEGAAPADQRAANDRVLDRFQSAYLLDNLSGTVWAGAGLALMAPAVGPARSPYSGLQLTPYVRRDADSLPLWLQLMRQLLLKSNRRTAGYRLPARGTLDYSCLRAQHVAHVNALCALCFWPGIDVSEALQYPEYTCVASYRRLAVGAALLVPDGAGGGAGGGGGYLSFLVVRPGWRRAGIASAMLYHLLQTCADRDVTLHVSPTNPAVFLYQKFGFKVEELVQDFYEKYYDIDYKGCRHALLLRLAR